MGAAKRRGSYEDRKSNPKGDSYKLTQGDKLYKAILLNRYLQSRKKLLSMFDRSKSANENKEPTETTKG